MKQTVFYLSCLMVTACTGSEPIVKETKPMLEKTIIAVDACKVLDSSNWQAAVEKTEAGGFSLKVNGEVMMPSPGYGLEWSMGPMDRMNPPSLRLKLITVPPSTGVANIQVLTQQKIEFETKSPVSKYRSVIVFCGESQLTEIKNVELAN